MEISLTPMLFSPDHAASVQGNTYMVSHTIIMTQDNSAF